MYTAKSRALPAQRGADCQKLIVYIYVKPQSAHRPCDDHMVGTQTADASAASSQVGAAGQNPPSADVLQQTNLAAAITGCWAQLSPAPSAGFIILLTDGNPNLCAPITCARPSQPLPPLVVLSVASHSAAHAFRPHTAAWWKRMPVPSMAGSLPR